MKKSWDQSQIDFSHMYDTWCISNIYYIQNIIWTVTFFPVFRTAFQSSVSEGKTEKNWKSVSPRSVNNKLVNEIRAIWLWCIFLFERNLRRELCSEARFQLNLTARFFRFMHKPKASLASHRLSIASYTLALYEALLRWHCSSSSSNYNDFVNAQL